jgi:uncharacterized protein (DUF58 family)
MGSTTKFLSGWRNAVLGTLLVLSGLGAALLTVLARRDDNSSLTTAAAVTSLLIVFLIVVLVLPPLARSARLEIARIDLPVDLTSGGLIFIGVLVVVGFAAWNTGNNLLFLVFALLTSTLFISWFAGRAALRDLVISARFPDHIFAGEEAPVIVTIRNRKRFLPSFSVLIEARGPLDGTQRPGKSRRPPIKRLPLAFFTYVPHHAGAEQRVEQTFPRRGHVLITGFELSTRFPFGFLRLRRRLRAKDVDIVVYPALQPVDDELNLLPMNAGRVASSRRGFGHDLLLLRDYQPQDDLRHVDWKATARVRRLTVREFASEDERRVTVSLDTVRPEGETEKEFAQRFERGVTLAASLVAHFIGEGSEVRLAIGQEGGRFGTGKDHMYSLLRRLALADYGAEEVESANSENGVGSQPFNISSEAGFTILVTPRAQGTIPSEMWRRSHVIFF